MGQLSLDPGNGIERGRHHTPAYYPVSESRSPVSDRNVSWRLALFYAAAFGAVGIILPYWQLWLSDQGLTPAAIGLVGALGLFARAFTGPLFGYLADKRGDRRGATILLAVAALTSILCIRFVDGFLGLIAVNVCITVFFAGLMPMIETMGIRAALTRKLNYGGLRMWGSAAFILTTLLGGYLLALFGSASIIWSVTALHLCILAAAFLLPRDRMIAPDGHVEPQAPFTPHAVLALVRRPAFLLFLGAAALTQASHGFYYAVGSVHWRAEGTDGTWISFLWGAGVAAEIVLLYAFGGRRRDWLGPAGWLAIGAVAAILRWSVTALGPAQDLQLPVQLLHGLTFGATHLGAMLFLGRAVPHAYAASGQNIYGAATAVMLGLSSLGAGRLLELAGGHGYFAMAGLGAAGLVCAALLARRWRGEILPHAAPA